MWFKIILVFILWKKKTIPTFPEFGLYHISVYLFVYLSCSGDLYLVWLCTSCENRETLAHGPHPHAWTIPLSVILMLLRIIVITTSIGKNIIISLSAEAPFPDPLHFPPSLIICSWAHCLPLSLFIFPPDPSLRLSTPLLSAPTPLSLALETPFIYLSLHLPTSLSTPLPTSVPVYFFSILIFGKLLGSFVPLLSSSIFFPQWHCFHLHQ